MSRVGPGRSAERIDSLLVLPFKNLSGDRSRISCRRYHRRVERRTGRCQGVAGDLANVISALQGNAQTVSRIARELKVSGIVEGSVLRSADRIRINVQLVRPGTEKRIWGQNVRAPGSRPPHATESEVTRAIVDEIRVKLTPGEQRRLAKCREVNPEAHVAYAKGRFFWNKRTEEGLPKGSRIFRTGDREGPWLRSRLRRPCGLVGPQGLVRVLGAGRSLLPPGRQSPERWNSIPISPRRIPPWRSSISITTGTGLPPSASFCGQSN